MSDLTPDRQARSGPAPGTGTTAGTGAGPAPRHPPEQPPGHRPNLSPNLDPNRDPGRDPGQDPDSAASRLPSAPRPGPDPAWPLAALTRAVKLVIWDLDDSFWHGTLSEGGVRPRPGMAELVRSLAGRGIVSTICSKNDPDRARAELERTGTAELFVFPRIGWAPKGPAIAGLLADMGLRAADAVFLDDNPMNLAEAQHYNPGLACIDARADLRDLADLPACRGRPDPGHERLGRYRLLERRAEARAGAGLSNTDFLRLSDIRVTLVTDIDPHMDRVVELLNRTNQLNYTKIRADSAAERAALDRLLATSGVHAGLVRVTDRHGDYGPCGFFCLRSRAAGAELLHFTFSCRILDMGVPQWLWQRLGRPAITPVGPVAAPLDSPDPVDWITEAPATPPLPGREQGRDPPTDQATDQTAGPATDQAADQAPDRRLCLVGGCDLLQVSFYCGRDRTEFVNTRDADGYLVRYDDIGLFLNDRTALRHDGRLKRLPGWGWEDMMRLDRALGDSDLILLSLYYALPTDNLFTFGDVPYGGSHWVTVPPRSLRRLMRSDRALWFAKTFHHRRLPIDSRVALIRAALDRAARLARPGARIFVLGAAEHHGAQAARTARYRAPFNAMCRAFCAGTPGAVFVDVDTLLNPGDFVDSDHYTRLGYHRIARFVTESA